MRIKKILNNNAIVVMQDSHELVVTGKGIGFQKKVGDFVEETLIDRTYYLTDPVVMNQLEEVLQNVDYEVMKFSESMIEMIKIELDTKVQDSIYYSLTDHIQAAVNRYRQGIQLSSPLLFDIKRFYPVEHRIAKKIVQEINRYFEVELDENEEAFIALHIVDSTVNGSMNEVSYRITTLIKDIINIVRRYFQMDFNENSIYYYRFVTHLRLFGQRLFTGMKMTSKTNVDDLLSVVSQKYPESFSCSKKIQEYISHTHNCEIGNEEVLYLTIHIQRIIDEYQDIEEV